MATIQSQIELYDAFSAPMMNIISSVNLGISAMMDMQGAMDGTFDEASIAGARDYIDQATMAVQQLSEAMQGNSRYIQDSTEEQRRYNHEIQNGVGGADRLMNSIKGIVATYATVQTVTRAMDLSDQMTATTARLNMMNDSLQTTEELQNMIYQSAERSRGSYQATADAVSKLGLMAGDAFSGNSEVVAFMEQINKQFTIAGTETSGIQAAMLQLTQAMGSGVLRGEEYNSVLEQAPNIIQAIADYLEVPDGELKDMAADGLITAEIVKGAVFAAADDTNAKFESMPMTFAQVWTSFQNHALMAFQPVFERMSEMANSESFQAFMYNASEALTVVADVVLDIFDLMINTGNMVADNWDIIAPVVAAVAGAMALYYAMQLAVNTISAVSTGVHVAIAGAQLVHAAATGTLTAETFAQITAQNGLNASLYACPIVWIVALIIALVAAIYAGVAAMNHFAGTSISATGVVAGVFATLGAHVINTFVVPLWNKFAALANFFGNMWNDPIAATKVLFYDMCLTVLGYIQNLAAAIEELLNSIPGIEVEITSGLDSLYANLEAAQNEVKDESGWTEYVKKMEFVDYSNAWNAGYDFGEGIEETVSNFNPRDLFKADNIPSPDDYMSSYADMYDYSGLGENVADIAGNTGAIKDSLDITAEELKYMRDMAEQEAINRFTLADVHIEQTNHNSIGGSMDLDGVVSGLNDALDEAIEIMTEGEHK
ncbi:tape measure protein [Lachnospiraceae bacterium 38-10]